MSLSAAILRKAGALLRRVAPALDGVDERAALDLAEKLAPRRQQKKVLPFKSREERKKEKRLTRKESVALVRPLVEKRAGGFCECGCGIAFDIGERTAEWDEFHGRQHVTVEETWMLIRAHHRQKSENDPTREAWDDKFKAHCAQHGYRFRKRLYREPLRRRG